MALTSSPDDPQPLGRVIGSVKDWVSKLGWVWVEAQVIELNRRANWAYLTLRDTRTEQSAKVSCSLVTLDSRGPIEQGMTVVAHLHPSVYDKNASLSFECNDIQASGEGRLLAEIERRKRLLQAEGLFDPARKKRLPFLPRAVGLLTGANSAAERDVVSTITTRWPQAQIVTRHALVQGAESASDLMRGLTELDANPGVDVIIIARGGGSLEDLLPFSDEGLVRAVAAARTPVISAIGHEPDTPLIDYVADVRALTPTDAGKRVVPDAREQASQVRDALMRVRQAIVQRVTREEQSLADLRRRPVLRNPTGTLDVDLQRLADTRRRLALSVDALVAREQTSLEHALSGVRRMSPKATLDRGYSILVAGDGTSVTSIHDVDPDDDLLAYLADG
ncbi:MAG TPA: exodeoxyribonuclease VII large subunit, partial [Propionibacteriaceae bacterium]|nr:exodeoxyribonuclease VII large subunit [Propionibacteriaceae bacterium]